MNAHQNDPVQHLINTKHNTPPTSRWLNVEARVTYPVTLPCLLLA